MAEDDRAYPQDQTADDTLVQDDAELQETFAEDEEADDETTEDLVAEPIDDEEDPVGGDTLGDDEADDLGTSGGHEHDLDDQDVANAFEDNSTSSPHP